MREKFVGATYRDFAQRYQGTYGWLYTDKKHFVYVNKVDIDATYFEDINKRQLHLKSGSDYEFEFLPVMRGYVYGEDDAIYYLNRVPARMWRRGICQDNTSITDISGWAMSINLKNLHNIFAVDHQPYRYDKENPCALSKHFAIDKSNNVLFLGRKIGTRSANNQLDVDPMFYQELVDTNRKLGFKFTVKATTQ